MVNNIVGVAKGESVVVICTKNRPVELEKACVAAHVASPQIPILVVDVSTTDASRRVCSLLGERLAPQLKLSHVYGQRPGLARQRNEAVDICRRAETKVIHFIDDDTEVEPGYFDAIERRFRENPSIMGIGGVVINQPRVKYLFFKRLFLLGGARRGSVLISGRNMMGQYLDTRAGDVVDWLCGCSMSYRASVFDELRFDSQLRGYSLGEDYDFSFRLSRKYSLAVEPAARCVHHITQTSRESMREHARERTEVTYRWVTQHRELGVSVVAFWWSTLGDAILHLAHGLLTNNRQSLQQSVGVVRGVVAIARETVLPLWSRDIR